MKVSNFQIPQRWSLGWLVAAIWPALLIQACAEVPITHRKSLHLVPESELLAMSFRQYSEVLKESKLSTDQQKVQMVCKAGYKIAKAAEAFLTESGQSAQIKKYLPEALPYYEKATP